MPNLKYSQEEDLLNQVIKNDSERGVLKRFLNSKLGDKLVSELLYQEAARLAKDDEVDLRTARDEAVVALIQAYKRHSVGGINAYERMVVDLVKATEGVDLLGKQVRPDFPGKRKRAEVILKGKIVSDLSREDVEKFLAEKAYASILRRYAQEMFRALNAGLGERTVNYLLLKYRLAQIETRGPLSNGNLQKVLFKAFCDGTPVEVVHIKSLRFTYPSGRQLKVIDSLDAVDQLSLNDRRIYPSERVVFSRLGHMADYLREAGLEVKLTTIVSDPDLDYCFPKGQEIVSQGDVAAAKEAASRYVDNLRREFGTEFDIASLSEFLDRRKIEQKFNRIEDEIKNECKLGGGVHIKAKVLEDRVNEQFEHYREMFGHYSREQARFTAVCQIANVIALTAIFESFLAVPIFVCDTRGIEDELIGAYNPNSVVKFFTKLKDPVEIIK